MGLIRFHGRVKSKKFDEYGNCFIDIDIHDCYKISHINNDANVGAHIPRCHTFKIFNCRPLSCINNIDIAKHSKIGDRVTIKAYELYTLSGIPVNRYQTVNFDNYH